MNGVASALRVWRDTLYVLRFKFSQASIPRGKLVSYRSVSCIQTVWHNNIEIVIFFLYLQQSLIVLGENEWYYFNHSIWCFLCKTYRLKSIHALECMSVALRLYNTES